MMLSTLAALALVGGWVALTAVLVLIAHPSLWLREAKR
jgi:hypothetical protein